MSSRPADWYCLYCQHLNFSYRDSCQRCTETRPGGSMALPGDWYCSAENCGAHNYASRPSCFKCGAFKVDSACIYDAEFQRQPSVWRPGDWICTWNGCGQHNFANRTDCIRCHTPKAGW